MLRSTFFGSISVYGRVCDDNYADKEGVLKFKRRGFRVNGGLFRFNGNVLSCDHIIAELPFSPANQASRVQECR